ncbi:hypothetical protein CDL12_10394 [Handroanthus impetiginosus]|uniref:BING4 C-terminal domain-containing protein n=1 Tax=Handroanthus impetiginosus TaxID=429701 RepID=A0A2G9HHE4_9LAMI|nr:hypothetical protein CDL12_10394 [Handroanthus impetiginosus]
MEKFQEPDQNLQFLNKHFLLMSVNKLGQLHYQDITTGEMVGNFRTGLSHPDTMKVNPFNNVVAVGHSGGIETMWKPTSAAPLVKMLCHKGPITTLASHSNGHLMATAGMERKIKLWDLRKDGIILGDFPGYHDYSRYMGHSIAKGYQVRKVLFRPYEDSSILIPGSGEPNFDIWVANPFETRKQRNKKEVRSLLHKLPPETIMLDATKIGSVRPTRKKEKPTKQEREAEQEAPTEGAKNISFKKKTKGRSKPSKMAKKKQEAIAKAKKPFLNKLKRKKC